MSLLAPALLLLLLDGAAASPPPRAEHQAAFPLVLTSGAVLQLEAPARWAFGQATVTTLEGKRLSIRHAAVDHEATQALGGTAQAPDSGRRYTAAELARIRRHRLNLVGDGTRPEESALEELPGPTGDEASWRARAMSLRQEIDRLELELRFLERQKWSWSSLALGAKGYDRIAASKLGKIRARRKLVDERLRQARGELARLEDEARRERVPPGWLR
jgi:hypothetical protein